MHTCGRKVGHTHIRPHIGLTWRRLTFDEAVRAHRVRAQEEHTSLALAELHNTATDTELHLAKASNLDTL